MPPSNSSTSLTDGVGETGDPRDAVTDLEHAADLRPASSDGENDSTCLRSAAAISSAIDGELRHLCALRSQCTFGHQICSFSCSSR